MRGTAAKRFLIEFILGESKYNNAEIIGAVIDFKVGGLSGIDAATRNGVKHRNTVYRATKHYDKIVGLVEGSALAMGLNWLYANRKGKADDCFKVVPIDESSWLSLSDGLEFDRSEINLFVKVQDRFIPL